MSGKNKIGETTKMKTKMKKLILAAGAILMATSSAWGARANRGGEERTRLVTETVTIRLGGQEFRQDSVIRIKQALRQQGVDLNGKAIKSITVLAKSRQGRGTARLVVDRERSASVRVDVDTRADRRTDRRGLRRLFDQNGGMNRVSLESPIRVQRQLRSGIGSAQVELTGNIKVARIKVELVSEERSRQKPRERSDEEVVIDIIGGIIGGIIENERDKKRGRP